MNIRTNTDTNTLHLCVDFDRDNIFRMILYSIKTSFYKIL